jgi:hypothetical protein
LECFVKRQTCEPELMGEGDEREGTVQSIVDFYRIVIMSHENSASARVSHFRVSYGQLPAATED